jgi:hypothetical protein
MTSLQKTPYQTFELHTNFGAMADSEKYLIIKLHAMFIGK